MKIYSPKVESADDGNQVYRLFMLESPADRNELNDQKKLNGNPYPAELWSRWKVIPADTTPRNFKKPLGDRTGIDFMTDPMMLSDRAITALKPSISLYGQFLPLTCEDAPYSLFNITNVIDALDEQASNIKYYKSEGMRVLRYAFKTDAIKDEWIFKISQQPRNFAFVTDRFVDLVNSAGLTGFDFQLLWSDE